MWERYKGSIMPGMILHHKCQNRRCCNPDHLEMVIRKEHQALHMRPTNNWCGKGHQFTPENTTYGLEARGSAGSVQMSGLRTGRPGTRTSSKLRGSATKPDLRSRTSSLPSATPRMMFPRIRAGCIPGLTSLEERVV
jgi:hypothetical protein